MTIEFEAFPKIPRMNRECIITEKIDGTNAAIVIEGDEIRAQSRSRLITTEVDNHGLARWVEEHGDQLKIELGEGRHFGEWWGLGIQRGYGQTRKRFSLFNTWRWSELDSELLDVVPVLYAGLFKTSAVEEALDGLRAAGSCAAPGYNNPEGVIVFHVAANEMFKVTLLKDEAPKGSAGRP